MITFFMSSSYHYRLLLRLMLLLSFIVSIFKEYTPIKTTLSSSSLSTRYFQRIHSTVSTYFNKEKDNYNPSSYKA